MLYDERSVVDRVYGRGRSHFMFIQRLRPFHGRVVRGDASNVATRYSMEVAPAIFLKRVSSKYIADSEIMASRGNGPATAKILLQPRTLTVAIWGWAPRFANPGVYTG